jgi:hypothetical protein
LRIHILLSFFGLADRNGGNLHDGERIIALAWLGVVESLLLDLPAGTLEVQAVDKHTFADVREVVTLTAAVIARERVLGDFRLVHDFVK